MLRRILGTVVGLVLLSPVAAYAMPGDRDPDWGAGGEATYDLGFWRTLQSVGAFVALPDGGVAAAGYSGQDSRSVATVVATDADGMPRAGFGSNGGLLLRGGSNGLVTGMAVDSAGRLVASVATMPLSAGVRVERLTASGVRDTTFGIGGVAEVPDREPFRSCFGGATAIDEQARILVACVPRGVVRFTAAGSVDTTYGVDGFAALPDALDGGVFELDSAGRLLVGGEGEAPWVARLRPDGKLDPTFAGDGMRTGVFGSNSSPPWGLAEDATGRIVISGDAGVTRLLGDGTRDGSFAGGEISRPALGAKGKGDVALDEDGRVLWATDAPDPADPSVTTPTLFRLGDEGRADPAFAPVALATATGGPIRLAVENDRVLVAVHAYPHGGPRVRVVALDVDGDRDDTWGDAGVATLTHKGPGTTLLRAIQATSDGSAYLAGLGIQDGLAPTLVVRARPNGTLDPAFHGGGADLPETSGFEAMDLFALASRDGGGVVALGMGERPEGGTSAFLAGFRAVGGFDPTYGDGGLAMLGGDAPEWSSARVVADGDGHVVARTAYEEGKGRVWVSRRGQDGRPDPGWRLGVPLVLQPAGRDASVHDVIRTRGGAIVIAGALSGQTADEPGTAFVLKLLPGGAPDPAFGEAGVALSPTPIPAPTRVAIAEDPAGRLIVASGAWAQASVMTRLDGDTGARDATFGGGGDGVVIINANPDLTENAEDVAIDDGGRILVLSNLMSYPTAAAVSAFGADGTPEGGYGNDGTTTLADRIGQVVHVDLDGQALVLLARPVGSILHSHVARLQGTGAPSQPDPGGGDPELPGQPQPGPSDGAPHLPPGLEPGPGGTVRPAAPPRPDRPPITPSIPTSAPMDPSVALRGSRRASTVRRRGLRVAVFCPAGCRGQLEVLLSAKDARRLRTARRVAHRRLSVSRGGLVQAAMRLPAKVVRARRPPVVHVRLVGRDSASRRLRTVVARARLRR